MLIYDNMAFEGEVKNNYIALGSFDGLHLGHLSLLDKIKELSVKNSGNSVVFTFKNHPRKILNSKVNTELLMTNEEKINILVKEDIDILAFKDFDEKVMKMMPEEFIKWLCESYNIKGIVVGFNFKFGYKNLGDVELLNKFREEYRYSLDVIEAYKLDDEVVSSTRIRTELLNGEVEKAGTMLSRPYLLKGEVIDGKKLGRTIGFPTANLRINTEKVIPQKGVYYTNILVDGKIFKGITNIGNNPTVNGQELTVETHILNFNEDIYGKFIEVHFIEKIRNEVKFSGIEKLTNQLKKDKNFAEQREVFLCQS